MPPENGSLSIVLKKKITLEKEIATCSSVLAWKIPCTENLVGYSPWGLKESAVTQHISIYCDVKWVFALVFLPEELGASNSSISLPICLVFFKLLTFK